LRRLSRAGADILIKRMAKFRLAEGAVLEVGYHFIIQDFPLFQLTLPSLKVYIENNTVIGRRNIIIEKNLIHIDNYVLIGANPLFVSEILDYVIAACIPARTVKYCE
jgi:acetyltransferase-like isoleucine patch superfamily enzyme